jgi:hypothetical protein
MEKISILVLLHRISGVGDRYAARQTQGVLAAPFSELMFILDFCSNAAKQTSQFRLTNALELIFCRYHNGGVRLNLTSHEPQP